MSQQRPVLFLGATGGCANAALVHTLRASIPCIALARTPSKLVSQLEAQSLTPAQLANLTTLPGNALSQPDVKAALLAHNSTIPATIVTGLGGSPKLQFDACSPLHIAGLDDPHVCATAARTLVAALREIYAEQPALAAKKPSVVFVSTTGVSRGKEDVPFAMRFLYHQALALPHKDKREMEDVLRAEDEASTTSDKGADGVFRAVSGVRPTLLAGAVDVNDGLGWEKLRAGTEEAPEMGYSVKRADVGEWIFMNLVRDGEGKEKWEGEMASLTS